MFRLRGSRREKTEEIIKKFLKSYAQNEKSKNKKDLRSWLIFELQNEFADKKIQEIEKMADELIAGVGVYFNKKKEVEKYQRVGISTSDYIGDVILDKISEDVKNAEIIDKKQIIGDMKESSEILANYNEVMIYEAAAINDPRVVANTLSANRANTYVDNVNSAIGKSNEEILSALTTRTGEIIQNPNLDGFIFEEHHAGTFNIDAAVKEENYYAKALKPELGETYGKNSVDMTIEDSSKIVRKYQAKAYKNANETAKSFYDRQQGYKYKFQSKLVPSDQTGEIPNSVDKLKFGEVESKNISKEEIKNIQEKYQSGDKEAVKFNFEKDVDTLAISKQIGKQAVINGTMGIGIGMALDVGTKLVSGEEVEVAEVIETGVKTGTSMGLSTAVAGGIRVAVEKNVVPKVLTGVLANNSVVGAVAASSVDMIGTAFKLGSGEINLGEATKRVGTSVGSAYGAIIAANWGYGAAMAAIVGLGTIGAVGTIIGVGVALTAGAVCGIVGSKVGGAIAKGIGEISKPIVNGAVEIVKAGVNVVKSVAKGVWEGVKTVGKAVVSGVKAVGSAISSAFGAVGSFIGGLFGW
jgi:PE-PGRS family protein